MNCQKLRVILESFAGKYFLRYASLFRIRPMFENELENCLTELDGNYLKIINKKFDKSNLFEFDKVCN